MKKQYLLVTLLAIFANNHASDQSLGSMRQDLPQAEEEWEMVGAGKEHNKDAETKITQAEQIRAKLIKLRSKEEIDKEIIMHCGSLSKDLCLGDAFGGKEVEPVEAGNKLSAQLLKYTDDVSDELDKGYRLQMTSLLEPSIFKIVFKGHPDALRTFEQTQINRAVGRKYKEMLNALFADDGSECGDSDPESCDEDSTTSAKSSNSDNEDVAGNSKADEKKQAVVIDDVALVMEEASDDESGRGLHGLKKIVRLLTRRGNEDSSDDEQ